MATLKVLGDVIQIKTELTEKDYKKISNYAPEALKVKDDKDNELFGISMGDAHWSKYGIAFCSTDADGKLFMTTPNPVQDHSDPKEEKEAIKELFAQTIFNLEIVEANFDKIKTELAAIEQNAAASIEMVDAPAVPEPVCCCTQAEVQAE